jgi:hypothetical protein
MDNRRKLGAETGRAGFYGPEHRGYHCDEPSRLNPTGRDTAGYPLTSGKVYP